MPFRIIHRDTVKSAPQKYISGETRDNGLQESFVRSKIHYDPKKCRRFDFFLKIFRNFFRKIFFLVGTFFLKILWKIEIPEKKNEIFEIFNFFRKFSKIEFSIFF